MKTFKELNLIAPIERAVAEENYVTPTPIQAKTIPHVLAGRDILGCAQTGTGKTAAFALPILNRLGKQNSRSIPGSPLALIIAPTRELAIQIDKSFKAYGRHLKVSRALVYGGVKQHKQVQSLRNGSDILIATPGRLLDLMEQGQIRLHFLQVFVLDEADRMLDMGFMPDLRRIIAQLPQKRQSLFFSATLPPDIVRLTKSLLRDPISVNVTPKTSSLESIEQRVMFIDKDRKKAVLKKILTVEDVNSALVFTRTKRAANYVAAFLGKNGINATAIHSDKTQTTRQRILEDFRKKKIRVLVATDVAARGIDIDGISHVVNFEMPVEPENYTHRIGRTGRAGATGIAISFCSFDERSDLRAVERIIGQKVPVDPDYPEPDRTESSYKDRNSRRRPNHRNSSGGRRRKRPGANSSPRKVAAKTTTDSSKPDSFGEGLISKEASKAGGTEKPKRRRRNRRPRRKAPTRNNS